MSADDAQMVADEVARLRATPGTDPIRELQAQLLEHAPAEVAAAFLRELALRALGRFSDRHDPWLVSAELQLQVYRERKAELKTRKALPQPLPLEGA